MSRRSRRPLRQSPNRADEGEHPHAYNIHGSHLLASCHGRRHAISPTAIPPNHFPSTTLTAQPANVTRQPMRAFLRRVASGFEGGGVWAVGEVDVHYDWRWASVLGVVEGGLYSVWGDGQVGAFPGLFAGVGHGG